MKIKSLVYVLMGTMLVTTSCSDNELEKGNDGSGTVDPVNASALVNVYSDKSGSEASLLVGDVLVKDSRTLTLNVPAACEKVYMKYNTVSGTEATKEFALSPVSRGVDQSTGFNFETNRLASVTLALPEDAVQPTNETDQGYLFYHNTGVVMFEDGWPTDREIWYDEDFNDVVFEYDLKVTECQAEKWFEAGQGYKEGLKLTLDIRAKGGRYPIKLGVVLGGLDKKYIETVATRILLKEGQGKETELATGEMKAEMPQQQLFGKSQFCKVTVDTEHGSPVIIMDGLSALGDNTNFFQTTKGFINPGQGMLRAEIILGAKVRTSLTPVRNEAMSIRWKLRVRAIVKREKIRTVKLTRMIFFR